MLIAGKILQKAASDTEQEIDHRAPGVALDLDDFEDAVGRLCRFLAMPGFLRMTAGPLHIP